MKLVVTDEAQADIERIADYIAADSPRAALRLVTGLRARFREIKKHPHANALARGFEARQIRRKVHGSYLIFYRVGNDRIEIVHVLHGARDYVELVGNDKS